MALISSSLAPVASLMASTTFLLGVGAAFAGLGGAIWLCGSAGDQGRSGEQGRAGRQKYAKTQWAGESERLRPVPAPHLFRISSRSGGRLPSPQLDLLFAVFPSGGRSIYHVPCHSLKQRSRCNNNR